MADRFDLIARLGALRTDAAQRGDDRAADTLLEAIQMLTEDHAVVAKDQERRRIDRGRKPRKGDPGNPRIPRNSTEGAEIQTAPQGFSPTPPFPNPSDTPRDTARVAAADAEMVERLTALLAVRCAELWPDVDAFIRRREYATWVGWMKEMLAFLDGVASASPADLAAVCRDDAALERPIGSPKGLRTFLATAIAERRGASSPSGPPAFRRNGAKPSPQNFDYSTAQTNRPLKWDK